MPARVSKIRLFKNKLFLKKNIINSLFQFLLPYLYNISACNYKRLESVVPACHDAMAKCASPGLRPGPSLHAAAPDQHNQMLPFGNWAGIMLPLIF